MDYRATRRINELPSILSPPDDSEYEISLKRLPFEDMHPPLVSAGAPIATINVTVSILSFKLLLAASDTSACSLQIPSSGWLEGPRAGYSASSSCHEQIQPESVQVVCTMTHLKNTTYTYAPGDSVILSPPGAIINLRPLSKSLHATTCRWQMNLTQAWGRLVTLSLVRISSSHLKPENRTRWFDVLVPHGMVSNLQEFERQTRRSPS